MHIPFMRVCLLMVFSLAAEQAAAQLFYEDCTQGKCRKAFIEKKEKTGEDQYSVKTIFLTYRQPGTTNADEQNRSAKVSCNRKNPTVAWGGGKPQPVDKSVFAKPAPRKGKIVEPEKLVKYDETTSLWKKVCPLH
jgi:hypothetical protein